MATLIGKIEPGDVIGRCRIIRELGRGGVGTVYLATHQTLQIEVALKVLSPSLSLDNPALAERFIREAQLAARIRHPNVIAVMDAAHDETTGLYFIVLEYVGGGSLSWHLRHGALPEGKALAIVTGIAHALVIAEENSIVHRDIKPDNIMLDLRGTPKLADLGLAKHSIDSRTSLTMGGSFMGTPAYMSPEQARDAKVADTRDDIYSLGATFYECLTGEPPFQGETPYNIMSELLTKPSPKPRAHRPELSRASDLICRKMMAKTRSLRYANPGALVKDLQLCQTFGDSGIDQLEAATFDRDSVVARQQALNLGVETSADGVALIPELPDDSEAGSITRPTPVLSAPRRADYGVFRAAALLFILVTVATLVLVWLGPRHPLPFLKETFALISGQLTSQPPPEKSDLAANPAPSSLKKHAASEQNSHPGASHHDAVSPSPNEKTPTVTPQDAPPLAPPVVLPVVNPTDFTNGITDASTNPDMLDEPIPAMPVAPASALEARAIAESSLGDTITTDPTGQAELLKIIGKRDEAQVTPSTWTFYFFDKTAAGHVKVVSVSDHKVVNNSERLSLLLNPFQESDVLPDDIMDSNQALLTAQALIPNVTVTGAEFVLAQKGSIPAWKVTLWAKDPQGEEQELGTVTILAEKNVVSESTLKPERVVPHP